MAVSSTRLSLRCLVLQGLLCLCAATSFFSDEDLFGLDLSDEQIEILEKSMTDYIDGFKDDLTKQISQPSFKRTRRGTRHYLLGYSKKFKKTILILCLNEFMKLRRYRTYFNGDRDDALTRFACKFDRH